MPATPLVNGVNWSWSNISLVLFGVPVVGITKIDYKRKMEKKNNYGWGQDPVSRGYGNIDNDGSIELYLDTWKAIIASAPGRDPLRIPPFDIQVTFGGSRLTADKDILRSVEFMDDPMNANQGDSKILVNIPLIIGSIER